MGEPCRQITPSEHVLSVIQIKVLALAADGKCNDEMSAVLGLSPHSIQKIMMQAMDLLGAASRTGAVAKALRMGIIK